MPEGDARCSRCSPEQCLGALLQVPEGTHPREFLKKLEQPEDPEEHGYNKKARRARDLPSILGRTSAAPRPHLGRTPAAPRPHLGCTQRSRGLARVCR